MRRLRDLSFCVGDQLERMLELRCVRERASLSASAPQDQAVGHHQLEDVVEAQPAIAGAAARQAVARPRPSAGLVRRE